ncbi:hypothetical protein Csa_018254 [Cucumis sativus]|uniref:Uncharacterized protein n=1 Tax=Cucumis sativus TaxID=3659 RepID=A0A0A0KDQ4_CUCSA|nr:hypothetical protein Csa_018254 [Cucumis sativus]
MVEQSQRELGYFCYQPKKRLRSLINIPFAYPKPNFKLLTKTNICCSSSFFTGFSPRNTALCRVADHRSRNKSKKRQILISDLYVTCIVIERSFVIVKFSSVTWISSGIVELFNKSNTNCSTAWICVGKGNLVKVFHRIIESRRELQEVERFVNGGAVRFRIHGFGAKCILI